MKDEMQQNKYLTEYRKCLASYTGEGISDFLYKFYRESNESYKDRLKRAGYVNYLKSVIDSIVNPVFSESILRTIPNDMTKLFLSNIDNKQSDIDDIMREALIQYKLMGNSFIIINNTSIEDEGYNDVLKARKLPFLSVKNMTEVYQYETDDQGKLISIEFINEVKAREINSSKINYQSPSKAPSNYDTTNNEITIIGFNRDEIYTYEMGSENEVDVYTNSYGFIPVIYFNPIVCPYPTAYDAACTNILLYNKTSELDKASTENAYSILELATDLNINDIELSSSNIITKPTNSNANSQFLSPDTAILAELTKGIDNLLQQFMKQIDILGAVSVNSGSASSGVAYAYEYLGKSYEMKRNSKLAQAVEQLLIVAVNNIINLINWEVEYPTEFIDPVADMNSKLDVLSKYQGLGLVIPQEVSDYMTDKLLKLIY